MVLVVFLQRVVFGGSVDSVACGGVGVAVLLVLV